MVTPERFIGIYDDLIDPDLCLALHSHLCSPQSGWRMVAHGNTGDSHLHWVANFDLEASTGLQSLFNKIAEATGKQFEILRVYANGMTTGQYSTVHLDDHYDGMYTGLVYLNPDWEADWHGETLFYNEQRTDVIKCVTPRFARAVIFDGRIPHGTTPPTVQCKGQRQTLAFKLKEIVDQATIPPATTPVFA